MIKRRGARTDDYLSAGKGLGACRQNRRSRRQRELQVSLAMM